MRVGERACPPLLSSFFSFRLGKTGIPSPSDILFKRTTAAASEEGGREGGGPLDSIATGKEEGRKLETLLLGTLRARAGSPMKTGWMQDALLYVQRHLSAQSRGFVSLLLGSFCCKIIFTLTVGQLYVVHISRHAGRTAKKT